MKLERLDTTSRTGKTSAFLPSLVAFFKGSSFLPVAFLGYIMLKNCAGGLPEMLCLVRLRQWQVLSLLAGQNLSFRESALCIWTRHYATTTGSRDPTPNNPNIETLSNANHTVRLPVWALTSQPQRSLLLENAELVAVRARNHITILISAYARQMEGHCDITLSDPFNTRTVIGSSLA